LASTTVRSGRYQLAVGPGLTAVASLVAVMATRDLLDADAAE